ncbi:MAG TPA: hydrogenase maturation protease [Bryocella sp.]|nr:hydrogenase maturation protease [Bryocella sp.]
MSGKILVAGIGNIFLGDDAFGVEAVNRLARRSLPGNVCVVDFGIRSFDLAYALMEEWDLVILVDALPRGGEPGTLYTFEPDLAALDAMPPSMDAHTMNPAAVLQLVKSLGGEVGRVLVVGCEPGSVEPDPEGNMGLSEQVMASIDEAVRIIEQLVAQARSRTAAA